MNFEVDAPPSVSDPFADLHAMTEREALLARLQNAYPCRRIRQSEALRCTPTMLSLRVCFDSDANWVAKTLRLGSQTLLGDVLLHESIALCDLAHDSVVKLVRYIPATDREGAILLTQSFGNTDLRAWKRKGLANLMQPSLWCELASKLLDALHWLEERSWVHGDIKPSNLLLKLKKPIALKLTDFALAQYRGDRQQPLVPRQIGLGTWAYLAPERRADCDPTRTDVRCDWWSTGVVLRELLAGMERMSEARSEVDEFCRSAKIWLAPLLREDPRRRALPSNAVPTAPDDCASRSPAFAKHA